MSAKDFAVEGTVYQIGLPPLRIDIKTEIDGLEASDAYRKAKKVRISGIQVRILSLDHILLNKKATGREKDKLDVKVLQKMKGRGREKNKKP